MSEVLVQEETTVKMLQQQWQNILQSKNGAELAIMLKEFVMAVVKSEDGDLFVSFLVENRFFEVVKRKIQELRSVELLQGVFSLFEWLLKVLRKEEELSFFLLKISQQGFISESVFPSEQDQAYFANFLKLMVRKLNHQQKFLSVFLNSRDPHFPLLLQLLKLILCKDLVMRTSAKLAILEICTNHSPLVQKYIANFPFVLFYPLCMATVARGLRQAADGSPGVEIEGELKYLQEFIGEKERISVDMYTNCFLSTVGRFLYSQLTTVGQGDVDRVVRVLKVLIDRVLPQVGVVKVLTALFNLFSPTIPSSLRKSFQKRSPQLEDYWLPQQCAEEIIGHCRSILFQEEPSSKSLLKLLNSYIPRSRQNWLYHQMKKIGELIGFTITLNGQIEGQHYMEGSFLKAMWSSVDDKWVSNDPALSVLATHNEELLYWYLRVLAKLATCQGVQGSLNIQPFLSAASHCTSLALVQSFHDLVILPGLRIEEISCVEQCFHKLQQRLVYFVLTKGWKQLLERIWESYLPENDNGYTPDIYRQIECDILLYVALRTLLGTPNNECVPFDSNHWEQYPPLTCQTIIRGQEGLKTGGAVYLSLQGQYLNVRNEEEELLNKQQLLLEQVKFWEEGQRVNIIGSEKCGKFEMVVWMEKQFRVFLLKEVRSRGEMADRIGLQLRQLLFDFKHP